MPMNKKKWVVELTETTRAELSMLIASGHAPARKLTHARILLKTDAAGPDAGWEDDRVAEALEVSRLTVERVRKRFVTEGLEAALNHRHPKNHRPRRLDGDQEAHLIALTCSAAPAGRERWTLRLLANAMVELEYVDTLSYETVRTMLKKTNSSPG